MFFFSLKKKKPGKIITAPKEYLMHIVMQTWKNKTKQKLLLVSIKSIVAFTH